MHSRTLVEASGAGQALRIDPKPNLPLAACVELAKRVLEERQAQSLSTPCRPNAELAYPAHLGPTGGLGQAEGDSGDLVPIHGQEPEAGVIRVELRGELQPVVIGPRNEAIVVGERLAIGLEDSWLVLVRHRGADRDRLGKGRHDGRLLAELDL